MCDLPGICIPGKQCMPFVSCLHNSTRCWCPSKQCRAVASWTKRPRSLSAQCCRQNYFSFLHISVMHVNSICVAVALQACPLLVPKYTMYSSRMPKDDWYKTLGYKDIEDPKSGEMRRENSDEFVSRMSSMVLLYGAIVQTDTPGNAVDLAHGWSWLSRFLNSMPATR
eukprot:GHRR01028504.1.p1 GENE.GHRR01028504.1~~GHRR01028504.1.p1  ORF type:complete len:168 (-),score=27.46 GHRR01028504.1:214-717(-)